MTKRRDRGRGRERERFGTREREGGGEKEGGSEKERGRGEAIFAITYIKTVSKSCASIRHRLSGRSLCVLVLMCACLPCSVLCVLLCGGGSLWLVGGVLCGRLIQQRGYTALMKASQYGKTETVQCLLSHGAKTDVQNKVS